MLLRIDVCQVSLFVNFPKVNVNSKLLCLANVPEIKKIRSKLNGFVVYSEKKFQQFVLPLPPCLQYKCTAKAK